MNHRADTMVIHVDQVELPSPCNKLDSARYLVIMYYMRVCESTYRETVVSEAVYLCSDIV